MHLVIRISALASFSFLAMLLASFGAGLYLLLGRRSGARHMILGAILVIAPCLTVFMGPLALGVLAIAGGLYVLIAGPAAPSPAAQSPEAVAESL